MKKRSLRLFFVIVGAAILLSFLLFDIKLHIGGDDATYLLQGNDFVQNGTIPIGFKSPGYPMVLAFFIWIAGFHILILKFTSLIFFLGSIVSFYFIFKPKLEPIILFTSLSLFAVNLAVLEYSHHVYSEVLFLFIQLWALYFLWKSEESNGSLLSIFLVALFAMAGFYIRALGGTLPLAIALWFLTQKQWKKIAFFIMFCILLYAPLKLAEYAHGTVVVGQASGIFMVNPYQPALGSETILGFATRISSNLFLHFNYLIPNALSLPHWEQLSAADGKLFPNSEAFISVLLSCILVAGCIFTWRHGSKVLAFLALYSTVYILFLCFALQTIYPTVRYLVPIIPLMIILFLSGLQWIWHKILRTKYIQTPGFKRGFVFSIVLVGFSNLIYIESGVEENYPVLKANLQGNEFYGYSQDWINYLNASRWIAQQYSKESTAVICRKPEFFQIYTGGYKAYGVYSIEATDPDTIIAHWQQWKMTHLLYDNFQWSSTLRRYVQPVAEKYPHMFELVHQEGSQFPSYIFRLNYLAAIDSATMLKGRMR
jgi:hypothetical protein